MNNCPKCGNPLQAGTSSCPICGTNLVTTAAEPAVSNNTTTAPAVQAAPQAQAAPAPQAQAVQAAPAAAPAPAPAQVAQPAPATAAAPATQPAVQPVVQATPAPAPAPVAQAAPQAASVAQPVATQPVVTPVAPVDANSIAPTVKPVELASPVPSIPASLTTDAPVEPTAPEVTAKPKKKSNKTVLIVLLLLIVAGGVAAFMMFGMGGTTLAPNGGANNNNNNGSLAITSVSSNGYKLELQDGWMINEDGSNVIITNTNATVAIKLEFVKKAISTLNETNIKNYFTSHPEVTGVEVEKSAFNTKEAFIVTGKINEMPVQYYFIGGGSDLILGASVAYQSEESKSKYSENVNEMITSLSYSDDSLKAISSMEMYSSVFNVYGGIINSATAPAPETPATPETPEQPQPEQPTPNQQPTTPENPAPAA